MGRKGLRPGRRTSDGVAVPDAAELVTRLVDIGTAAFVKQLGLTEDQARVAMREVAHDLCFEYAGQRVTIPKDMEFELTKRDLLIWERFTGFNEAELAAEYGLSRRQIGNIVRHVRQAEARKRQSRLPGFEDGPIAEVTT